MNHWLALALACGGAAGTGAWLILREVCAVHVDLGAALDNLDHRAPRRAAGEPIVDRCGSATLRALRGLAVPRADLAIVAMPAGRWMGTKVLLGCLGLVLPGLCSGLLAAAGLRLPVVLPAATGLGLGVALFLAPDAELRSRATRARREFSRAVGVYVELVALERRAASGTVQAMETAAGVSDSWTFLRIRETLMRSRLDGVTPWTALSDLAHEVRVPELSDFAGTMRLAGEESAQVYQTLRAQARSLRTSMLNAEHARANASSDSMAVPAAAGGMVFLALLMAPALMRML